MADITPQDQILIDQMAVVAGDTANDPITNAPKRFGAFYATGLIFYGGPQGIAIVNRAIARGLTGDQFAAACKGLITGSAGGKGFVGKDFADVLVAVNATIIPATSHIKDQP